MSLRDDAKLKAFASITIDGCFVIRGLKIIQGNRGIFVAMPSRKREGGDYEDIVHPINNRTRQLMEKIVIETYEEELAKRASGGRRDDDDPGWESSGVRSPLIPPFGPLTAGESRRLEWDVDPPLGDQRVE